MPLSTCLQVTPLVSAVLTALPLRKNSAADGAVAAEPLIVPLKITAAAATDKIPPPATLPASHAIVRFLSMVMLRCSCRIRTGQTGRPGCLR